MAQISNQAVVSDVGDAPSDQADAWRERDRERVRRLRQGDERALRELFDTYYAALCRFATTLVGNRDASEDIVQGLFTRIWEQRENWAVRGSVRAYLYQAVQRRAVNSWRAARVRQAYAQGESRPGVAGGAVAPASWPDGVLESIELSDACERAVAALPPRGRQAFELHYKHGLSCREVGEIMGISPRTVENHVGRALFAFRRMLAPYLVVALLLSGR